MVIAGCQTTEDSSTDQTDTADSTDSTENFTEDDDDMNRRVL